MADADTEPSRPIQKDYLERVAERLENSYDLERDRPVGDTTWTLYGRFTLEREKYFLHPTVSYARHDSDEHLFVRRVDAIDTDTLDTAIDLGHTLADDWIEADERHYSTDFTFVFVAPTIPEAVADRVEGFRDRTLLKYGYYGHYEVNLVVVAPRSEELAASEKADVAAAFRTWTPPVTRDRSLFGRLADTIFGRADR
ncbi:hypothetical protein [Halococcus qingdaonensis]|uniref:hypothetical protein n=1 Tax=Halococcus qingdaonensis TaxID=224402 RepID=UPI002117259F|nr:hypothetical protein [Halococcus qingdaonensis]